MRVRASNPSICTFFGPWRTTEFPRAGKCEPLILSYVVTGCLETCSFEAGLSKFYFLVSRGFKVPLPMSSFQSWLQCACMCGYVGIPVHAGMCGGQRTLVGVPFSFSASLSRDRNTSTVYPSFSFSIIWEFHMMYFDHIHSPPLTLPRSFLNSLSTQLHFLSSVPTKSPCRVFGWPMLCVT